MRLVHRLIVVVLLLAGLGSVAVAERGAPPRVLPGALGGGETLLPNGWRIKPAGRAMTIGDLPIDLVLAPDGQHLIVTNSGYDEPTLRVVDLTRGEVTQVLSLEDAWMGLAFAPDGNTLYASAADANAVTALSWRNGRLAKKATIQLGAEKPPAGSRARRPAPDFIGGLAVSPDGARLAAVHVFAQEVSLVDLSTGAATATAKLSAEPYTCLFSKDGRTLFVSLWGGAKVLLFDGRTLAPMGEVAVGEHPNALVQSADGARLFVACAHTNAVWAIDLAGRKAVAQISIALFPQAPPGATPNALALSPDGTRMLVANADNNTVAVVDVSASGDDRVLGFIPTGWYPTGVRWSRDGRAIYILAGKGLTSMANPRGRQPGIPGAPGQYSGSMLDGALSLVETPDEGTLAADTKTVYGLTPYSDATRLAPADAPAGSPIPARVGGASPIKHVFYVIRENRTYDQILGDLGRGNGDPNLALFGEDVTPNAHALARQFVTFDNFYVNAEVSYSGHAFSTAAYADDFVEKIWPLNYGGRGAKYLSEGGGDMRNPYGNITAPANGYIWDACVRGGVSVRSYGEFAEVDRTTGLAKASVPGLAGRVSPTYAPFDLKIPDQDRADAWLKEFQQFEADGTLPALSIIRLGDDHTNGTSATARTPRAMVADNDLALGRIIEAISHSRDWSTSAVFVLEDDAQDGPDHVDAHRSVVLVASPYARRGVVDSTLYTTSGVLRTMELVLGLPPMSQYDAAATPMYQAFTSTPSPAPFAHVDARISITEMNGPDAPGAAESAAMDFHDADMIPEDRLNQILWWSVKGRDAVMPPPVHAAFVRRPAALDDDDRR